MIKKFVKFYERIYKHVWTENLQSLAIGMKNIPVSDFEQFLLFRPAQVGRKLET